MSQAQKIIKYFALALAALIIFNIIFVAVHVTKEIYYVVTDKDVISENMENLVFENNNIAILSIDVDYAKLIIKKGDTLKAETNNKYITCTQQGNKLLIKEKDHFSFSKDNRELVIYIPENLVFDETKIEAGAGQIIIEILNTKNLDFELGAGKTVINNLNVLNKADIESGAGSVKINSSNLNNLKLDLGVGKFELTSILTGTSEIEAGVGELNINLQDKIDNYKITTEKGLGTIKINNNEVANNSITGNGINNIKVIGGVGSIKITSK